MDVRVISIGTLSAHRLWDESAPVRTGHATCTLVRAGDRTILVDPGLPERALVARLGERAGIGAEEITDVFLTSFKPDTSRGIRAFDDARWWAAEREREAIGVLLIDQVQRAAAAGDSELRSALETDVAILQRCQPAPDSLVAGVDLFPMPGVTPGLCGLLVAEPTRTTLICGDAVPTVEHLDKGQVLQSAADVTRAQESFNEALEIADVLVLGRDNAVVNPVRRAF